jgi:hypothetical protein
MNPNGMIKLPFLQQFSGIGQQHGLLITFWLQLHVHHAGHLLVGREYHRVVESTSAVFSTKPERTQQQHHNDRKKKQQKKELLPQKFQKADVASTCRE